MDVSPKTLREVEFREKMRGYHPEDVDQFLERVAAGIEVLQDRLRQAIERAQRAEQAATEAGGNDDALRRTLLLAQRTADLAVQEGREQAARLVSAAEHQAQTLVSEAEQRSHATVSEAEHRSQSMVADAERRSQSMLSEAEQNARRGHDEALVEVRAELAKLEVTRQRLQIDVDSMTRWVGEHRSQLRAALEDALTRVDQINVRPPPVGGVRYPLENQPAPVAVVANVASPVGDKGPHAIWAPRAPTVAPVAPVATATGAAGAPRSVPPAPPGGPSQPGLIAWEGEDSRVSGGDTGGESDPYFAELRRAISDRDPLGAPSEESQSNFGGHPEN